MLTPDVVQFVNVAVIAFLISSPAPGAEPGLMAMLYVLSEGPLASALIAWECAWVFSSPDHIIRYEGDEVMLNHSVAKAWET